MLNADELGHKGENIFRDICNDAHLVCNKSDRDRTGWDFIVEFPNDDPSNEVSLDKRAIPLSAHFQVKTMWADNDRFSMRLSSAERLAKELKPSFVYVLKIDEENNPSCAYLVHMRDQNLEAILKRLRREQKSGNKKINKKRISFDAKKVGELLEPTGTALRAALLECCGEHPEQYVREKGNQLKSLGFGKKAFTLKGTIAVKDDQELEDAFLGLTKVPFTSLEAVETRFGISLPDTRFSGDAGFLHIKPTASDVCTLVVRGENALVPPAVLSGEVFRSFIPGKDKSLVLVKTSFFQIKLPVDKSGFSVKFTSSDDALFAGRFRLEEWINFFQMVLFLSESAAEIEVRIANGPTLPLKISKFKVEGDHWGGSWLRAAKGLRAIFRFAALGDLSVTLSDIGENTAILMWLNEVFSGHSSDCELSVKLSSADANLPRDGECLYLQQIAVAGFHIGFYLIITISRYMEDDGVWLELKNARFGDLVLFGDSSVSYEAFSSEAIATTGIDSVLSLSHEVREVYD